MDHSHMDHGHGDMGHGGDGMDDMCSMSMLFTWQTKNLCIIFPQWHVRGPASLVFSLLAIVLICAAYEALRAAIRRYESWVKREQEGMPRRQQAETSKRAHIVRSALYALQTFYAFMVMLLFMTYNGWVMLAVTVGAFIGHVIFGSSTSSTRETACH